MGVWIETCVVGVKDATSVSHPSWVCGLKHRSGGVFCSAHQSHPSWVCGLKQHYAKEGGTRRDITPFVGVWIETEFFAFA